MPEFDLTYTLILIVVVVRRRCMGVGRVPDARRAQDLGVDAGPHRPQPRRPVGPAPADRRRAQVLPQGRHHPDARRQALLLPRPRRRAWRRRCWRSHRPVRPDAAARAGRRDRRRGRSPRASTTAQAEYRSHFTFVIAPGLDIGILYVFAIGSLAVYGVILGGWASNNKYSLLGVAPLLGPDHQLRDPAGHVGPRRVPDRRLAEPGADHRLPGRPRLVHPRTSRWRSCCSWSASSPRATACRSTCPRPSRNWSAATTPSTAAMKFGLILPRRVHPHDHDQLPDGDPVLRRLALSGPGSTSTGPGRGCVVKLVDPRRARWSLLILLHHVVRWTIPRFRFDQLMDLAWKVMIPLALVEPGVRDGGQAVRLPLWLLPSWCCSVRWRCGVRSRLDAAAGARGHDAA